ncbi:MAG TPA: hypothetical protein VJK25_03190 [Patescibacteria group bacterium]|nr:hypothetical protein [Patescibacteria group bacterium]
MKIEYLSYDEQRQIIEDLYNLTDSIEACRKLDEEYGIKVRPGSSVKLNDFARALDKTRFLNTEIEKAIKRHAGYNLRLRDL